MGCALEALRGKETDKTQMEKRFLILGLDGAGKTSILNRLAKRDFVTTIPTVGLNVEQVVYRNMSIALWDLGGAATLMWKHYYQNTDAVIFVVDSTDRVRMDSVRDELSGALKDADLAQCPLLVYANKQDREHAMKVEEVSRGIEFDKLARGHKFIESCSAMKNEGIWQGLDKVIDVLVKTTPKSG